jgi:hypothetical protein
MTAEDNECDLKGNERESVCTRHVSHCVWHGMEAGRPRAMGYKDDFLLQSCATKLIFFKITYFINFEFSFDMKMALNTVQRFFSKCSNLEKSVRLILCKSHSTQSNQREMCSHHAMPSPCTFVYIMHRNKKKRWCKRVREQHKNPFKWLFSHSRARQRRW